MTALRAFPPRRRRSRAARRARRLARRLVVDPWAAAAPSLLLQFAFNRRALRAAAHAVRARRARAGGGAGAADARRRRRGARRHLHLRRRAEHEARRRIAVKYVPHGELREPLLAPLGEMEMPHTLITDDLHELPPPAAAAGGGGAAAAHHGARARAAEPKQARAPARRDAGGVHRRPRRPRRRLPERGARAPAGRPSRCSSAPRRSAPSRCSAAGCLPSSPSPPTRARRRLLRATGAHDRPRPAGADGAPPAAHYFVATMAARGRRRRRPRGARLRRTVFRD